MICNKPNRKGVCSGDSGGPLFYLRPNEKIPTLIGTLSGVLKYPCTTQVNCGCHTNKSYHVLLYKHKEWIKKVAGVNFNDCSNSKLSKLSFININFRSRSLSTRAKGHFNSNLLMIIVYTSTLNKF